MNVQAGKHYTDVQAGLGDADSGLSFNGNWARSDHDGQLGSLGAKFALPLGPFSASVGGKALYLSPKNGDDGAVVGDVVAEVGHGGLEERRDPDCVHAQRGDVVQALDDARQVAHAITVGIEVAARVDLVDDGSAPPWIVRHRQPPSGHAGPARSGPKSCSGKLSGGPAGMAQPAYVFTQAAAFAGPGTPARPVCARIHGQRL